MPLSELHKTKRKKNIVVLAIIAAICILIWAVTMLKIDSANASSEVPPPAPEVAARIKSGGVIAPYDLPTTSPVVAYDVYSRQLAYRAHAMKLRNQIQQRAVHYAQPSAYLTKQYKENLQAQQETITEGNIPSYFATWDEAYGE